MEHRHLAILLLLSLSLWINGVYALNATTDGEALLSFKILVSDPRNTLSAWNHTSPLCSWLGVSCTPNRTRVQSLLLGGLGLSGTIPHQLSKLTSLETLNLSDNLFDGRIPQEISRLSLLRRLILTNNSIGGSIPRGLSHCSNLEEIILPNNKLDGSLPTEIGLLSNLKILDVTVNNLTGLIPPTFGNLTFLTRLCLSSNQFSGKIPNELGLLQNLHVFDLSGNYFSGEIPYSIYNISSLFYFSVRNNTLFGKLPPDIVLALPNLREIHMAQNKFHGPIPTSISNASRIQKLDLSYNGFEGVMPLLGNLNNLIWLNLYSNSLSSTTEHNLQVINSLTNCSRLEYLSVGSNQLAGKLPSSTANLSTHLQRFCADQNFLSGEIPPGIGNYHNLAVLSLLHNSFQGTIPTSIELLHKLERFNLDQNMLFGEIPNIFGNLTRLYELTMDGNHFSGSIPKSIGDCKHLDKLTLVGNRLTGSIPKEIFSLPDLMELRLAWNSLSGSLPDVVSGLTQLSIMDISENHLSGVIPATIGDCSSLSSVNMSRNKFHGSIPKSIGKLLGLESLNLSSNNLSGPIPAELGKLRVLQNLNLSFNDLEGQVRGEGVFKNLPWNSLQGNSKLCLGDQEDAEKLRIPKCFTKKKKNWSLALKITVSISFFTLSVCFLFCLISVLSSRKKSRRNRAKRCNSPLSLKGRPPKISYSEILSATNNFAEENLIGKGGFGSVYKGVFSGGSSICTREDGASTIMAIKVLDLKQNKASRSFIAECEALRSVRHRNLVKAITSCSSIDHGGAEFKALVMEFMSNSSIDKWLYPEDNESGPSLNLTERLNIAIDVASAVDYLHHDCDPPVVHCDLKPGNVLLDDDMGAHVGDFGLARFLLQNTAQNQCSTILLKGSIGYIPPEYGLGGQVSTSGDVYSYGILLLEIFTGKKPTDEMFKDGLNLHKFASAVYGKQIGEIVDFRLIEDNYYSHQNTSTSDSSVATTNSSSSSTNTRRSRKEECLSTVIKLGLSCAADVATERLTMRETVARMREIKESLFKS